ncbi:YciI family protein [Fibrella aquatilis]|uniref:Transcription initiation protein n=1 Tax=Fibrella aquatilis TaxID=2817059 RepID=A0A939G9Q4_9BACT|nr:YciI family protein [Fibrella aquatilis]MBO0932646.1 transcription initiation protein [Fibrella aquatilis]
MSEFMLLFRQPSFDTGQMSPAEFAAIASRWQAWVGGIEAGGNLVSRGTRLATEGKVVRADGLITDGPFVEVKERLGSFVLVRADSLDEATALAHGCPAISAGGSVEVRPLLV